MYLPISAPAWRTVCMLLLVCMVELSCCEASSALNWAIWAIICVSSIGFIGSWFWSWAMSSFRKSCLPSDLVLSVVVVTVDAFAVVWGTWTWFRNVDEEMSVI